MRKKRSFLLIFLIGGLSLTSCKKYDEAEGPTDIRIKNLSTYVFDNVFVDTGFGENSYGTVIPNQETEYKRFDKAYREATITLEISGTPYTFTPVAYTFEVYLGRGKFTYEVWVNNNAGNLSLDMQVTADAPLD